MLFRHKDFSFILDQLPSSLKQNLQQTKTTYLHILPAHYSQTPQTISLYITIMVKKLSQNVILGGDITYIHGGE